MTLAPGTRLGPYVIDIPVGAGGMGEVYRARDTRLERDVAIKVLPAGVRRAIPSGARGSSAKPRRSRRCRTRTSSRSTTSAHEASVPYAVTELLDGETLRDAARARPAARAEGDRHRACRSRAASRPRTTRASSIAT